MKFNTLIIIFLLSYEFAFISSSRLTSRLLIRAKSLGDYKALYNSCKDNYEKMYKMLSDKITKTEHMEGDIIDSFKNTIMKVYTKTEKSKEENNRLSTERQLKITELETELDELRKRHDQLKASYNHNIDNIKNELNLMKIKHQSLETNHQVLTKNYEEMKKSSNKKDEDIFTLKKQLEEKGKQYTKSLKQCNDNIRLQMIKHMKELDIIDAKLGNKERSLNNISDKLAQADNMYTTKVSNEIERGNKINQNLDLILRKLENYSEENKKLKENDTNNKLWKETKFKEVSTLEKLMITTDTSSSSNNKAKSESESVSQVKSKLGMQLDLVLFEGTNKARTIFTKINNILSTHFSLENDKNICESQLKEKTKENLKIKEALAELEIKERINSNLSSLIKP